MLFCDRRVLVSTGSAKSQISLAALNRLGVRIVSPPIARRRHALGAVVLTAVCAASLAGPAHAGTPPTASVVYSFKGGDDGAYPAAGLISYAGALYGATVNGGGSSNCTGTPGGCGTVFSVTPAGVEQPIHAFMGGTDGNTPEAGLLKVGDELYGATSYGGNSTTNCGGAGCGTVFSVTAGGTHNIVYDFLGSTHADGAFPQAALTEVNGTLYGTTVNGGGSGCTGGCGTVFSMTRAGVVNWVYAFQGGTDGNTPEAGLVYVDGKLYGATLYGGNSATNCGGARCGTVFSVTLGGAHTVVYNFLGSTHGDGAFPQAGLISVNGTLYGATVNGGGSGCTGGCGTVFSLTTAGVENWVYPFQGGNDGNTPEAALVYDVKKNMLYGTTLFGGNNGTHCGGAGCGTVFSVTPAAGSHSVVYSFQGSTQNGDGAFPMAPLVSYGGLLYGTTQQGGADNLGTVFSFKP